MTIFFVIVEAKVCVEGVGILNIDFIIEFITYEKYDAANKVCDHDGDQHKSENVIDVHNEIFLDNSLVITIIFLMTFQKFFKPLNADEFDQSWQPTESKKFCDDTCVKY